MNLQKPCYTILSISGKNYVPDNSEKVGANNLITIDLSPLENDIWGDCARSYVIRNGKLTNESNHGEFSEGMVFQKKLHKEMKSFVSLETGVSTFLCKPLSLSYVLR